MIEFRNIHKKYSNSNQLKEEIYPPTLFIIYRIYRRKYLGLMVAATWIGAFTALIPTWRGDYGKFGMDPKIGSCSILLDDNRK